MRCEDTEFPYLHLIYLILESNANTTNTMLLISKLGNVSTEYSQFESSHEPTNIVPLLQPMLR